MVENRVPDSKLKAFTRVIKWTLKEEEAKECLARLERCKSTINLAITSQNWYVSCQS
jgi:hypothetical protein